MIFTDLKVIELASVLAGPSVGQFFAELGADVIKVENLITNGDVTRSWKSAGEKTDDRSAYFCCVNWGKRSLAVDLNSSEGKKIVTDLIRQADIVLTSYKYGDAEKFGVDYKTLSRMNPGLIYGQVTGYGPHSSRLGYDAILQAEAGYMFMNGEPGGASLKMPVALIDILAGHHLKEGLLLAMLEKTKNDGGKLVSVSLIQAALSSLANQGSNWLVAKKLPQKQGSAHPNISPYGDVFKTNDGKEILLAVGNDRQFRDLCTALNLKDVLNDASFETNQLRVENRGKLQDILAAAFRQFSGNEILNVIHGLKIPAGLIQNIEEALTATEAEELFMSNGDLTGLRSFVATISGSNNSSTHILPPPHLGEHTSEILLKYLNLAGQHIEILRDRGIIQ